MFIAAVIYGLWAFNGLSYKPADFFLEERNLYLTAWLQAH